jgi:hypothetical protein
MMKIPWKSFGAAALTAVLALGGVTAASATVADESVDVVEVLEQEVTTPQEVVEEETNTEMFNPPAEEVVVTAISPPLLLTPAVAAAGYVTVAWFMPTWASDSVPTWGQTIFTSVKTAAPDLAALDAQMAEMCGVQFQVDVYYDNQVTTDLIAGGFLLGPGNPPEALISGGLGTAWKFVLAQECEEPEPPTATQCVTTGSFLVTNQNEQGFNYSPLGSPWADTRVDGSYEYVDGALRLATLNPNDASGTNKVSGARSVNIPLAQYGGDFTVNFVASYGTIEPGINIRIDADGDGDNDVTLVAEPDVPGYLKLWTNTPGYLPPVSGGNGGPFAGDQNDVLALWPNAIVTTEAFVLGSGVGTDGDLVSWSTPCNTYTYDFVEEVVVEPIVADLRLTYMQQTLCLGTDPEGNEWRIRNSSELNVPWTNNFGQSGIAGPGDNFIYTEPGLQTMILSWGGGESGFAVGTTTKAGGENTVLPIDDPLCAGIEVPEPIVSLTAGCGFADVSIDYPVAEEELGFNAAATTERSWEVRADGVVIETVTVLPGASFDERYSFAEDSSDGSVVLTVNEVGGEEVLASVVVKTDCATASTPTTPKPPTLAVTGSEPVMIASAIGVALALLVLGFVLMVMQRQRSAQL